MHLLVSIIERELDHHAALVNGTADKLANPTAYLGIAQKLGILGPAPSQFRILHCYLIDLYLYTCGLYGCTPDPKRLPEYHCDILSLSERRRFTTLLLDYWTGLLAPIFMRDATPPASISLAALRTRLRNLQILTEALAFLAETPAISTALPARSAPDVTLAVPAY